MATGQEPTHSRLSEEEEEEFGFKKTSASPPPKLQYSTFKIEDVINEGKEEAWVRGGGYPVSFWGCLLNLVYIKRLGKGG